MLDSLMLSDEEKEVILHLGVNRKTRRFLQKELETYDMLRTKLAYPKVFGSLSSTFNIRHTSPMLIEISQIVEDNKNFKQLARLGVNPQMSKIENNILHLGFSLAELGILVLKYKGRYYILEGRTRLHILKKLGMENIIADVFEYTGEDDFNKMMGSLVRFATFMNTQNKPFGEASYHDIQNALSYLIEIGEIAKKDSSGLELSRVIIVDNLKHELEILGGGRLSPQDKEKMIHHAYESMTGRKQIISFPKGEGAQKRLDEILGAEKIKNDRKRGIVYIAVASHTKGLHKFMLGQTNEEKYKDVKEFRFVIHGGVLNSSDPEKDFITRIVPFGQNFKSYELGLSEMRFHGVRVDNSKVKVYGAIPMCYNLEHKYPMDEIYQYKV